MATVYDRDGNDLGTASQDDYRYYLNEIKDGPPEGFVRGFKYGFPDTIIYMLDD